MSPRHPALAAGKSLSSNGQCDLANLRGQLSSTRASLHADPARVRTTSEIDPAAAHSSPRPAPHCRHPNQKSQSPRKSEMISSPFASADLVKMRKHSPTSFPTNPSPPPSARAAPLEAVEDGVDTAAYTREKGLSRYRNSARKCDFRNSVRPDNILVPATTLLPSDAPTPKRPPHQPDALPRDSRSGCFSADSFST